MQYADLGEYTTISLGTFRPQTIRDFERLRVIKIVTDEDYNVKDEILPKDTVHTWILNSSEHLKFNQDRFFKGELSIPIRHYNMYIALSEAKLKFQTDSCLTEGVVEYAMDFYNKKMVDSRGNPVLWNEYISPIDEGRGVMYTKIMNDYEQQIRALEDRLFEDRNRKQQYTNYQHRTMIEGLSEKH